MELLDLLIAAGVLIVALGIIAWLQTFDDDE